MTLVRKLILLIALSIVAAAGHVSGQTTLGGEIGTDLDMHDFSNSLLKEGRHYVIERSLSRQYLSLNYVGPVATRDFAEMALRLRLAGAYFSVQSENDNITDNETNYQRPELDNILSSFSLFPLRTYSVRYTFGKTRSYTNRYEPGRRVDPQLQSPSLAVIRRYQSDLLSHSAQGQAALSKNVSFSTEIRHEQTELRRQYDFDENRDIWVVFTSTTEDPSPTHQVDVVNTLDDLVLVYVDLVLADSVSAGETVRLTVDKGLHEVDFVPSRFNSYRAKVNVQSLMRWRIVYIPPKGSADQDQSSNYSESMLRIGGEGRFRNETRFLYTGLEEDVQNLSSTLNSLNNIASYNVRPGLDIQMMSNYTATTTEIKDISSEENSSFLHQTLARMQKRGGPSLALSHSFNGVRSINLGDDLRSRSHIVNGQSVIPTRISGHTVDLRTTATFLSDNKDYVNNQYMVGVTNKLDRHAAGFRIRPQHELKYTSSSVDNPNARISSQSGETESRARFEGERSHLRGIGTLLLKIEWEWRSRGTPVETEFENRYLGEVGLNRMFSERFRLSAAVNRDAERYSLDVKNPAAFGLSPPSPRPDQNRTMYRLDLQSRPVGDLNFGANTMLIHQNGSKISRLSLSLSGRLPGLDTPIRSFLVSESRELEGLPSQSLLQMEAQLSYRFRQISLVLAYSLNKEKLVAEDYTYSQIYAKISRSFEFLSGEPQ